MYLILDYKLSIYLFADLLQNYQSDLTVNLTLPMNLVIYITVQPFYFFSIGTVKVMYLSVVLTPDIHIAF